MSDVGITHSIHGANIFLTYMDVLDIYQFTQLVNMISYLDSLWWGMCWISIMFGRN